MSPKNKGTHGRGSVVEEPDEFVQTVFSLHDRIQPHLKKMAIVAGLAMAGLIAYKVVGWRHEKKAKGATSAYMAAMKTVEAPLASDAPPEGAAPADSPLPVLTFETEEERRNASLKALAEVANEHGDIALTKLAGLHEAKLMLDSGRYDEAIDSYKKFTASKAPEPLRLTALEGIGYSLEAKAMANEDPAARQAGLEAALGAFANVQPKPEAPMRDYSLYHQGRLLVAMGKNAEGIAMYKQVLAESPDSPLAPNIESRLSALETSDE